MGFKSIFENDSYADSMSKGSQGYDDAVNKYLLKQTTAPEVDFSKSTLAEQMPEKNMASDMLGTEGDAATAATSFGPPPIAAIGLGLKTIEMIEKARMAKYEDELRRIARKEAAANRMAQIGQSLRV